GRGGDMLRARPLGIQVRAPDVHGVEAERDDGVEQLPEALTVCFERLERVVGRPVAVAPAVHREPDLAGNVVRAHERDRGHTCSTCASCRSASWSSATSTSCTAMPRRAACAAARPDAWPSSISVGSMRTEPNATWEAERQTGTSRFCACSRAGVSDLYGMP